MVDRDSAVLVYDMAETRSHVWLLTSGTLASHALPPRKTIEPLVERRVTLHRPQPYASAVARRRRHRRRVTRPARFERAAFRSGGGRSIH